MFWGVIDVIRARLPCLGDGIYSQVGAVWKSEDVGFIQTFIVDQIFPSFLDENNLRDQAVFQQDNASTHVSSLLHEFFQQKGLTIPLWPVKSPGLNVIEPSRV